MKNLLVSIAVVYLSASLVFIDAVFAQDSLYSGNQVNDLSFSMGGGSLNNTPYSFSELRSFFPESDILKNMFATNDFYENDYSYFNSVHLSFGTYSSPLKFLSKKHRSGWRFGINYKQLILLDKDIYSESSLRVDTLYDQSGNIAAYRDSVISTNRAVRLESGVISVESSYLLRFNYNNRWSFYCGLGGFAGTQIYGDLETYETIRKGVVTYDILALNNPFITQSDTWESKSEVKHLSSGFFIGGFIPFGIDFKLTRKTNGFDFMHLFAEGNSGILVLGTSSLRNTSGSFLEMSFGIRAVL